MITNEESTIEMFFKEKNRNDIDKLYSSFEYNDREVAMIVHDHIPGVLPSYIDLLIIYSEFLITYYYFGI